MAASSTASYKGIVPDTFKDESEVVLRRPKVVLKSAARLEGRRLTAIPHEERRHHGEVSLEVRSGQRK